MSDKLDSIISSLGKTAAQVEAICARIDWQFVESTHYDRDKTNQVWHPVQRPMGLPEGMSAIEAYAPKTVTVLALPTLYCITCAKDHACSHVNTVDASIGACDFAMTIIKNKTIYVPAERIETTAQQSHTGAITR